MVDVEQEQPKAKKGHAVSKSKLLKVPIRVRSQDGQFDDDFMDYVLEVDKDRIYIKTEDPYPVGTVLHLGLDLPGSDKPIHFKGEVVRINPHPPTSPDGLEQGMGIVFERTSYDNRKLINDYLDRVQSETRPEEYSMFLAWIKRISKPMGTRERDRIKKDLLKTLYSAREREPIPEAKRRKSVDEMDLLSRIPLLAELDVIELEQLSRIIIREEFRAGDGIFEEGDVGDKMFVIVKGAVDIVKGGEKGPGQVLVTLRAGDFFGEMSLIDESPRSASALAAEDSTLFSVNKKELALLLDHEPAIAAKIYKFFVQTLNQRLRETNEKIKSFVNMAQEMSQS